MEPISEGRQVLSDIERSIKNALALFNCKDLGGGVDHLYSDKNSTTSLHNSQIHETNNTFKISNVQNSSADEVSTVVSPPKLNYSYNNMTAKEKNMSSESLTLPFLVNPIQNTIEEMQRVLNAKCVGSTPFHSSTPWSPAHEASRFSPCHEPSPRLSTPHEPSPEDILNLYSQDLGICQSNNTSPRGDTKYQLCDNEHQKSKLNNKERKNDKKNKQKLKANPDRKSDLKKDKIRNSDNLTLKENKIRELMTIYGCSDKIKKPQSDSTLGSKSGISKNTANKPSLNTIISSKASSIAVSKKSRRKKLSVKHDDELPTDDMSLEKISRLSGKRKVKQRNSITKALKKQNLKRKIDAKLSADNIEIKLSKSHQTSQISSNHKLNKSHQMKGIKYQKQLKQKNSIQSDQMRGEGNIGEDVPIKSVKKTILKAVPHTKHYYGAKQNNSDIQSQKNIILNRQSQAAEMEHTGFVSGHSLINRTSDEAKLNRNVLFSGSGQNSPRNYINENSEMHNTQLSNDNLHDDFLGQQSQLHYTLPTHSSRSKEVDRFLNGSYQHLPFVIGQSTNKSHNLWVNIQEALSLIKQKVPQIVEVQTVVGLDTDDDRPISVISKLTTKSVKKPHQCPALINDVLYDIPEDSEAAVKSWENHPDCIQANIDPNNVRPRCSCLAQPSISYKKVLRQIFGENVTNASEVSVDMNGAREDLLQDRGGYSYSAELRKVLVSFTQEFEELNNKYEEMLQDPNASKEELQSLEITLQNKEEEIKEIISRVNEVKEISERARVDGSRSRAGLCALEAYKSTTSVRLAQTLRRVQLFKESLKSRPSVPYLSKSAQTQSTY